MHRRSKAIDTGRRCPACGSPHTLRPSVFEPDGHRTCYDCGYWWHDAPESVLPDREASNTQPKEERERRDMTFTPPPSYDDSGARMEEYINRHVIIEPVQKREVETKFRDDKTGMAKVASCWEVIVWTANEARDGLDPHTNIRVFNRSLVAALDVAHRSGQPVAGLLKMGSGNRKFELVEGRYDQMELLGQLWSSFDQGAQRAIAATPSRDEEPLF